MQLDKLAACAALVFAAHGYAASPNMKEGLWEITIKMDMAGMPAAAQPQVVKQCVTKQDIENPQKIAPQGGPQGAKCTTSNYEMQASTASWNWTCSGGEEMTGKSTMTFSGTSYTGTTNMSMKQGGKTQNMSISYTGKHLGNCK